MAWQTSWTILMHMLEQQTRFFSTKTPLFHPRVSTYQIPPSPLCCVLNGPGVGREKLLERDSHIDPRFGCTARHSDKCELHC